MLLTKTVNSQIHETLGKLKPELGGILGSKNGVITTFYFDENSQFSNNSYYPCVATLNHQISEWSKSGILFCGVIHSHPRGDTKLSHDDILFARKIIECNISRIDKVYFPITTSTNDSDAFYIRTYVVDPNGIVEEETIIIDDNI